VSASKAPPRPWRAGREGESTWFEGPKGSAAGGRLPANRRIVCEFRLYGEEAVDAETEANFELIAEAVNNR